MSADEQQFENPFFVSATEFDENGNFTVNINFKKNCIIEAYKLVVEYDSDIVSTGYRNIAYGYYRSFLNKYNENNQGICMSNNINDKKQVVFAGAQPVSAQAAVVENDRFAYVTFSVNNFNEDTDIVQLLGKISVRVENCSDGDRDIVKDNAGEFAAPIAITIGDDIRGEQYNMGDIDFNGIVNLEDTMLALKAALGIIELEDSGRVIGDMDRDGNITLDDTLMILKLSLGIEV